MEFDCPSSAVPSRGHIAALCILRASSRRVAWAREMRSQISDSWKFRSRYVPEKQATRCSCQDGSITRNRSLTKFVSPLRQLRLETWAPCSRTSLRRDCQMLPPQRPTTAAEKLVLWPPQRRCTYCLGKPTLSGTKHTSEISSTLPCKSHNLGPYWLKTEQNTPCVIIYCILASCYIRLTLNICSFVRQCNTFTS
jgi:hypothetical protein